MSEYTVEILRGSHDLAKGVSLRRAPYAFGSNQLLNAYAKELNERMVYHRETAERDRNFGWMPQFDTPSLFASEFSLLPEQLEDALHKALRSGKELVAVGSVLVEGKRKPLARVPAQRWEDLTPDFENNMAEAPGITIVDIRVFQIEVYEKIFSPREDARFSKERVRTWYRSRVTEFVKQGIIPSREEDWQAAIAAFGKQVPRKIIRALRRELAPEEWTKRGRRKRKAPSR